MHDAVLAGPPTGAGVVTLEDNGGLLAAEFREKTSALNMTKEEEKKNISSERACPHMYHSVHVTLLRSLSNHCKSRRF